MQIHAKLSLIILQHEQRNLKREISPNNAKHHKQEASILVSTSIFQITLIVSEQKPEDFYFEIIGRNLTK